MNDVKQTKFVCIDKDLFAHLRSLSPRHITVNEYVDGLLRKDGVSGDYSVYPAAMWNKYYGTRSNLQSIRVNFALFRKLQMVQRHLKQEKSISVDLTSILHFAIYYSIYGKEVLSKPSPWAGENRLQNVTLPDPYWVSMIIALDGTHARSYSAKVYGVNEWESESLSEC